MQLVTPLGLRRARREQGLVKTCSACRWPVKVREFHNHHFDSTIWNSFRFRDDDIVISTYAKSGTTWMQQLVAQLVFGQDPFVPVADISPWVDLRFPLKTEKLAIIEGQSHRRFLKTHLPVDALVYSPRAKYIYVARDGRDVLLSLFNHHTQASDLWYRLLNETPGLVGPPMTRPATTVQAYFDEWLFGNGEPFWPFWDNVRSWWSIRHLPNLLLVHFSDLKTDLASEVRRIAHFLDIELNDAQMSRLLEHCSFAYMKRHGHLAAPFGGKLWNGGATHFINKGTNGRWRGVIDASAVDAYESMAIDHLGAECASWLTNGSQLHHDEGREAFGAFTRP